MPHEKHHRCDRCGTDFESGDALEEHVERSHPKKGRSLVVVAEDPRDLPFEVED